jgi:hypothetical protein
MDVMQEHLDAFNARDLDRFVARHAPDTVIEEVAGNATMQGYDAIRAHYGDLFTCSPELHGRILNQIRVGEYVIDEEYITGMNGEGGSTEFHGVGIYRIVDDKIVHVLWLH